MVTELDGRFVTARTEPTLVRVKVAIEDGIYRLSFGEQQLEIPWAHAGRAREVNLWGKATTGVPHTEGSAFFSEVLGREVVLVWQDAPRVAGSAAPEAMVSFADGYPCLLVGRASVDALDARVGSTMGERRFRANLVVEGCAPHAEDDWSRIRIGDAIFRSVKPCERCVLTTVDPETAERGKEPLRTLAGYRKRDGKIWFGINLVPETSASTVPIAVDEALEVLA